jgi:hypothetical protein
MEQPDLFDCAILLGTCLFSLMCFPLCRLGKTQVQPGQLFFSNLQMVNVKGYCRQEA